jgi:hypothetical protein
MVELLRRCVGRLKTESDCCIEVPRTAVEAATVNAECSKRNGGNALAAARRLVLLIQNRRRNTKRSHFNAGIVIGHGRRRNQNGLRLEEDYCSRPEECLLSRRSMAMSSRGFRRLKRRNGHGKKKKKPFHSDTNLSK